MANRDKASNGDQTDADKVEDAEIVAENTDDETGAQASDEMRASDAGAAQPEDAAPENMSDDTATDHELATTTPLPVPTQTVVERRGSAIPLIAAGILTAGIGFLAGQYNGPLFGVGGDTGEAEQQALIDSQSDRIAALENAPAPALSDINAAIQDALAPLADLPSTADTLAATVAGIDERLTGLDARVEELEKQPTSDGGVSDAALEAYNRDIAALRDELDSIRSDAQTQAAAAQEQIAAAEARAAELEANAMSEARAAQARAALTQIEAALQTGQPFDEALSELSAATGSEPPAALQDVAADGIPTPAQLRESFPDAARAALAADRDASGDSSVGSFLSDRLGLRSTEPREGSDADAVLSRAEAALRQNRLDDAIAESETLSEAARVELTDWLTAARARAAALTAAGDIQSSLDAN